MSSRTRSRVLGLLLVGAALVAAACTPAGGATTAPVGQSAAPGGASAAPASNAPANSVKGGYGY